jgi:hypothetical protein
MSTIFKTGRSGRRPLGWTFALLSDRHDGAAFDEAFIKPWLALEAALAKLGRSGTV